MTDQQKIQWALRELEEALFKAAAAAYYLTKGRENGGYRIPCLNGHSKAITAAYQHVAGLAQRQAVSENRTY